MKTLICLFVAFSIHADVTGLWAAKLRFGPDVKGTLTIDGDAAEIAGRSAIVKRDGNAISFALPAGEGSFRGFVNKDRVDGHWIQNRDFATPVTLTRDPFGHWRGTITPIDLAFTVFLPITRGADGKLTTFVRNPERNFGVFMKVDHIAVDGSRVTLLNGDKIVVEGKYAAEEDVISLPLRDGTYDFHRATPADEAQFYTRGKSPAPYVYRVPPRENDGWPVASLDDEHISREAIDRLIRTITERPIDNIHASDVHAMIIARHGRIVLEEYFHGFDR